MDKKTAGGMVPVSTEPFRAAGDAESIVVDMQGICKAFPGVQALDNVQFTLRRGEVHCLLGENGAGKSTLIKVLSGAYPMDCGKIRVGGKDVYIRNSFDSRKLGISTIYQEMNLVPGLSVSENLFLGEEETKSFPKFVVDRKEMDRRALEIFKKMHITLDPRALAQDLNTAQQQMVEIARSLVKQRDVIIMDEPTSSITDRDTEELFRIIRELKARGVSIIYISHRLQELQVICDRVTVMRDGKYIGTFNMRDVTMDDLIRHMVGRELDENVRAAHARNKQVALEVKNVTVGKQVRNASFTLHKGEILGFAGLVGSGRTELMRAIYGADKKDAGEIFLHGKKINIRSTKMAVRHGIGYLSEDRKGQGLVLRMEIAKNITLTRLDKVSKGVVINRSMEKRESTEKARTLSVVASSLDKVVGDLSGGNQQKVVIAKWLMADCDILIFDEPTRGIDVGARAEIYRLINQLAAEGRAIIIVSSDMNEILKICDRILVMNQGSIVGEFENTGEDIQEEILSQMLGGVSDVS